MLKPSVKLWLKKGKTSVIGSGRARLIRAIKDEGSIVKAAQIMKMSYRHAWGIVRQISQSVGGDIVITVRGGKHGGGAKLTALGERILKKFEENEFEIEKLVKYGPRPAITVDGIIVENNKYLILIRRKNPPFKGHLALPGGFVENNETTEEAVMREVKEELGVDTEIKSLFGVYSEPSRDPRQHTISIVYELEPISTKFKAGDDAAKFERIPIKEISIEHYPDLAFDHDQIIKQFLFGKK